MSEILKPCPFCGRKMIFYREEYINKYGHKVVEQYLKRLQSGLTVNMRFRRADNGK